MNAKTAILTTLVVPALMFSGCSSLEKKQMEAISRGVHATKESIEAGRFDLAKKYNEETARIVPPPKKPIKVNKFEVRHVSTPGGIFNKEELAKPTDQFVVLPEGFQNKPVLVENSDEFKKLLFENADLRKREEENQKALAKFEKQTDEVIRAKEEALNKKSGWLSWFGWLFSFGTLGAAIAIGILCAFFPALRPLISGVFGTVRSVINGGIQLIANLFKPKSP